jgi:hypothetical protein
VVFSPANYNGKTGLTVCCPLITRVKVCPFEEALASQSDSAVLSNQVKNFDWRVWRATRKGKVTDLELRQVPKIDHPSEGKNRQTRPLVRFSASPAGVLAGAAVRRSHAGCCATWGTRKRRSTGPSKRRRLGWRKDGTTTRNWAGLKLVKRTKVAGACKLGGVAALGMYPRPSVTAPDRPYNCHPENSEHAGGTSGECFV